MADNRPINPSEMLNTAYDLALSHTFRKEVTGQPFCHAFEIANLARHFGYGAVTMSTGLLYDDIYNRGLADTLRQKGFPESVVIGVNDRAAPSKSGISNGEIEEIRRTDAMSNPISHVIEFCNYFVTSGRLAIFPQKKDEKHLDLVIERFMPGLNELGKNLPGPEEVRRFAEGIDGVVNEVDVFINEKEWDEITRAIVRSRLDMGTLAHIF